MPYYQLVPLSEILIDDDGDDDDGDDDDDDDDDDDGEPLQISDMPQERLLLLT